MKIEGRFNSALVFTDIVEDQAYTQIKLLLDQEFTKGSKIRIMPDCHAGAGCVIGTTMQIKDKVVPNLVGVDIGCGMLTVELGKINIDFKDLDKYIRKNIPAGMNVHEEEQVLQTDITKLKCWNTIDNHKYYYMSIGSLGGGNHFIEIDRDDDNNKYLIIHTGSRNLGLKIAEYYQEKAIEYHTNLLFNKEEEIKKVIKEYKQQGRHKEIESKIKEISKLEVKLNMPKDLCYLEGSLFEDYIHDMDIAQKYANENRITIATIILRYFKLNLEDLNYFQTIHNYINMKDMILRKGSISAYLNEQVLIPINMRDGCIIGVGKGNEDYNFSAPHGAGRKLSRTKARQTISLEKFQKSMKGIFSTSICKETIDESPFAYKPIKEIINNIEETIDIIKIIKPLYNFKAVE